jgi:hypothetical protein
MAVTWKAVLDLNADLWGVPLDDVAILIGLIAQAKKSLALVNSKRSTAIAVLQCREDFMTLAVHMRYIKRRYFTKPPLKEADFASLGFKVQGTTRTSGGEILDTVEMSFLNDPRPDTHTQYAHYKKLGFLSKSKAPYHKAVFQIYIQGPGDPPPRMDDDSFWSRDITCMASPLVSTFKSTDAGKICWYRARWESFDDKQGRWTMAWAMIP